MNYTIKEIQKAVNAKLIQGEDALRINGISIDSRTIEEGQLFIAIKGKNFDGHRFIRQALKKGAAGVIVSRRAGFRKQGPVLWVKDTTQALGQIAKYHREAFSIPVIAITGSAGKTTTKEMIASILKDRYKVLKNYKTENNQFGVPLTLLKLDSSYDIAVLELGTNQPGDMEWLAGIVKPDVVVLTNIGDSHLQFLKNKQGVFKEKMKICRFLKKNAPIIFNADDPYLQKISFQRKNNTSWTYAISAPSDFQASRIRQDGRKGLAFTCRRRKFSIRTLAEHNVLNALAAICCGRLFKISYNNINITLKKFRFADSRLEIVKIKKITVINDTYNANPLSFQSALKTLSRYPTAGKKICVCGDMLELGERASLLHYQLGEFLASLEIDRVLAFGRFSRKIIAAVKKTNPKIYAEHYRDIDKLNADLARDLDGRQMILIKGSRGMKMERTLHFLQNEFQEA